MESGSRSHHHFLRVTEMGQATSGPKLLSNDAEFQIRSCLILEPSFYPPCSPALNDKEGKLVQRASEERSRGRTCKTVTFTRCLTFDNRSLSLFCHFPESPYVKEYGSVSERMSLSTVLELLCLRHIGASLCPETLLLPRQSFLLKSGLLCVVIH